MSPGVAALAHGPLTAGEALDLCERAYRRADTLDLAEPPLAQGHVNAFRVRHRGLHVLISVGTVHRAQWGLWNLRFWPRVARGDTRRWHGGFLAYARATHAYAKGKPVDAVVGHSLGAACTQIVAPALGVPGIALASPRPLYEGQPARADLVLNLCRRDDAVCGLPWPWWGFEHVGPVMWFRPETRRAGEDHRTPAYRSALDGSEPGLWSREPAEDSRMFGDAA